MTSSNLIEQAKRGDPTAIATLMNRSLQPQGISAAVERDRNRLRVFLEGNQVPNREALVAFVQNGITNLGIDDISTVEVSGKQSGQPAAWTQEWQLNPEESETGFGLPNRVEAPPPPVPPMPMGTATDSTDAAITDLDDDVIPLNPIEEDDDPLADLLAIGDMSGSSEADDPLEELFSTQDVSLLGDLEASLMEEASLLNSEDSSLEDNSLLEEDFLLEDDSSTEMNSLFEENSLLEEDFLLEDDSSSEASPLLEENSLLEEDFLLEDDSSSEASPLLEENSLLEEDFLLEDNSSSEASPLLEENSLLEEDFLLEDESSSEASPLLEEDSLLEEDFLLEEDSDLTTPISSYFADSDASESATAPPDEFDEGFSEAIRAGFSDLEYRPLETAPTEIDETDNLAPELLAAETANQLRNEIPESLLSDEPDVRADGVGGYDATEPSLFETADFDTSPDDPLNLNSAGSARFPSINDLATEGNLDFLEEPSEAEADENLERVDNLDTDEEVVIAEEDWVSLEPDSLGITEDLDDRSGDLSSDDFYLEDEEAALPVVPPTNITASPDMDSEEDIQLTSLDAGDDSLDWDEDRTEPLVQNEWVEVQDKRDEPQLAEPERTEFDEDLPHGQMVGSPMAIQPLDREGGQDSSDSRSQSRGIFGNILLLFVTGWIAALIGFSLWRELQSPGEPTPEPVPETSVKPRNA